MCLIQYGFYFRR